MGARTTAMAFVAVLAVSACGGGGDGGDTTTTKGGTTKTTAAGSGAIDSLEQAVDAVIRIESRGTFVDPAESIYDSSERTGLGSGSGFIIDPSGIAVTANHVVTGAAALDVYIEGSDEPVSAKVLGVSECSDLAVIDLDGDGYPFLDWYTGEIDAGLEINAAGFPLGDPEYTLLRGIVAKAEASGESSWSSIDAVIEHDANTQPGNSGGPLLTDDAAVVAIQYANADPGTGAVLQYAISAELAQPLVERLRDGEDVYTLGVNGTAIVDEESGVAGVWVSSVDTNSAAGELELQGGDIIERIEGLPVGSDGTMRDYCDILRSHDPTDQLSVQVLRFADDVRLSGEFNGDPLEVVESLGTQLENDGEVVVEDDVPAYDDYVLIADDTGALEVEVPASWSDIDGSFAFEDETGSYGAGVAAAPDLQAWGDTWGTPGMGFSATLTNNDGSAGGLLQWNIENTFTFLTACTDGGPQDYDDGLYVGVYQVFSDCGDTDAEYVLVSASPPGQEYWIIVQVQVSSSADLDALDRIIQTFRVVGELDS